MPQHSSGPGGRHRAPRTLYRFSFAGSFSEVALCSFLFSVIMFVQGWNIRRYPMLSGDEGTYVAQAWALQQGKGLANYTYWYDHPPMGWIQIAIATWIPSLLKPEVMTVASSRLVMLAVSAVTTALLYVLARRLSLPPWAAGLAMLLFGLSPLAVVLHREVFLDNLAVMWMLLAFCLAASRSNSLWHHCGAGMSTAFSVLTKETILVVLPALAVTMWQFSHRDTRKFTITGAVTSFALLGLFYPLFAWLKGELLPGFKHASLWEGISFQLMNRTGSGVMFSKGSNSYGVLHSWLYYDAVLLVGGLAGTAMLLLTRSWSRTARYLTGPALAVVILSLVAMRPSGYLPGMYVIQALPFLAVTLASGAALLAHAMLRKGRHSAERKAFTAIRWTLAVTLAATAAVYVVPRWYVGDRLALTADANGPYRAAAAWLRNKVPDPALTRVLVDDVLWMDLVHAGYEPGLGDIWFYKADLDPAVKKTMPHGYRDIDYVVASAILRRDASDLPTVKAALEHSTPVAIFGTGEARIEIREISQH
ncbi:ArnT family glycosyltransferase [Streptomyces sp. 900105245]